MTNLEEKMDVPVTFSKGTNKPVYEIPIILEVGEPLKLSGFGLYPDPNLSLDEDIYLKFFLSYSLSMWIDKRLYFTIPAYVREIHWPIETLVTILPGQKVKLVLHADMGHAPVLEDTVECIATVWGEPL